MGKGQTQQATSMANQNFANANDQGKKTQDFLWGNLPGAQQQAQDTYGAASGAYKSFMGGTGAYDPTEYSKIQTTNDRNISTGGYDPTALATLRGQEGSNIQTGGYDPNKMSQLQTGYENLTKNGYGGIDPNELAKIRTGYEGLSTNGGIDEGTAGAMRRQSAGAAQSVYSTLGTDLARRNAASGSGGGGGETAQMARQAAQSAATATTGVNAQIGQLRQTGTIAGLGGLSNIEQGTAAAQREALAGQSSLAGSEASNRIAATGQSAQTEASKAQGTLTASNAQQDLAGNAAMQRIQSAGGLSQLYSSSPGYVNSLVQQILQSQQTTGQLTAEQAQVMAELSKNPGLFSTVMNGITGLAGAAGGIMTGLGGLGVGGATRGGGR